MLKTVRRSLALSGLALAFSLIVASCGNDDDDAAPEATESNNEAPTGTDTPVPVAVEFLPAPGTLQSVLDRGHVLCGSRDDLPGFAAAQPDGSHLGFDIDMCRVVAAAVLGDADAVEIVPVTSAERFTALASGQFDVMNRNSTWTATRDGAEGADFPFIYYYDGQGVMVPASFAVQAVSQAGNYEEIFTRYPQLGTLAGSANDLWTNGGLMYVPPYR